MCDFLFPKNEIFKYKQSRRFISWFGVVVHTTALTPQGTTGYTKTYKTIPQRRWFGIVNEVPMCKVLFKTNISLIVLMAENASCLI